MKFRTEERTRTVEVERGGKTHHVEETYLAQVPVAPRDWDAIALNVVRGATALAVAGAVTWSTVAIGDLLAGVAPTWAAYLVAGVFDLTWITCMVLEWLSRYDRKSAALPIVAGWIALAMSVALISLHGHIRGLPDVVPGEINQGLILGICGGAVSVMAKGMWTVVMRHSAVEMDDASQAWLDAERREMNARLAVVSARRQLNRTEHLTQSEALALSAGQPDTWMVTPVQDRPVSVPAVVRGDNPQTDCLSVDNERDTLSHLHSPVSVPAPVRVPDNRTTDLSGRISHRAFVRGLLSADPSLSDQDLSAAVRSEYGQDTKTDSIRKAIQRARGDLSQSA